MLFFLGCDLTELTDAAPLASPAERLDAVLPGLATAVRQYTENLVLFADQAEAADPDLVAMLLPAVATGDWHDATGDGGEVDLHRASVVLKDGVLTGEVGATGAATHGVSLFVDTRAGPSPDLRLDVRPEGMVLRTMVGWSFGAPTAVAGQSSVSGETVRFAVDLRPTGVYVPDHVGAVTAFIEGVDRIDSGPAGVIGRAGTPAVDLWVHLLEPVTSTGVEAGALAKHAAGDPDLTLAVSLAYAPFLPIVAPEVRATVRRDAAEKLGYGLGLDTFLERERAGWRFSTLPGVAKLAWAWPAAEAVVYGALPLAWEPEALSLERYRFHVPDIATLGVLRDQWPIQPSLDDTAQARDDGVWAELDYRANDAGMEALCDAKALDSHTCFEWEQDRDSAATLGPIDGRPIPLHEASSVTLQTARYDNRGGYIGDCTTATTLVTAAWQAVGIAPLAIGYAGPDWYSPTHNQPLYFDGRRFMSTQGSPARTWDAAEVWVYAVLPAVAGPASFALGSESTGWARGGSVAGARMRYASLGAIVADGVPLSDVQAWILAPWNRGWPELSTR